MIMILNQIVEFIMCDMYEIVKIVYEYILAIRVFLRYTHVPLFVTFAETMCLETGEVKIITKEISKGATFKYPSNNSIVRIKYRFDNKDYAMLYHKNHPVPFPPYNLHDFTKRARPGIASITITDENFTELLKPYAGPKQNFYSDINEYGFNFKWTDLHKQYAAIQDTSEIEIMNSFGNSYKVQYNTEM